MSSDTSSRMDKYLGYIEKVRTFMNIPLGQEVFDPRMIISQIFLLQTTCYISIGFILFFLDFFTGNWVCLDQLVKKKKSKFLF